MASKLDMALDDIAKADRQQRQGGGQRRRGQQRRGGSGARGGGVVRKVAAAAPAIDAGSKLLVSNLHYGVTEADLKELFSGIGPLRKVSLAYDAKGQSKGSAEVEFTRKNDALLAMRKYNNVSLDGRPMKMEITAHVSVTSRLSGITNNHNNNNPNISGTRSTNPRRSQQSSKFSGRGARSGRRQRGAKPKTQEELDAEMDVYMAPSQADNVPAGDDVTMTA